MALLPRVMEAVIALHKAYHFSGPVVSLGVQDSVLNYMQVEPLLKNSEMLLRQVPKSERRNTTNVNLIQQGADNAIHAETFFKLMDLHPYDDIDIWPEEKPSLLHNLNHPVPAEWHGRYNLLVDFGCLEHVLNIGTGLTNAVRLLAVGGHAIHCHPLNHLVNHGYFQICPMLLKDFYDANGYVILNGFVFGQEVDNYRSQFIKPLTRWHSSNLKFHNSGCKYWLITLAKKNEEVGDVRWPTHNTLPSGPIDINHLKDILR